MSVGDLVGRWRSSRPSVTSTKPITSKERSTEVNSSQPHIPVLRDRCLELLRPALTPGPATVIDATLGAGGHTAALLSAFENITVIGIDRDPAALKLAEERIGQMGPGAAERLDRKSTRLNSSHVAISYAGL